MAEAASTSVLLGDHIEALRADWDRLIVVLKSERLPRRQADVLVGRFQILLNGLSDALDRVDAAHSNDVADAWQALAACKNASQRVTDEALGFLGGLLIRHAELDGAIADTAQSFADQLASRAGVWWSPVVVIGEEPPDDDETAVFADSAADAILQFPLVDSDIWHLPVVAHKYGYWIAKHDRSTTLGDLARAQATRINAALAGEPVSDLELSLWLPEVQNVLLASSVRPGEPDSAWLDQLLKRQQIHYWHLAADCFGVYFLGPAYAFLMLLSTCDLGDPFAEGDATAALPITRSRYVPSDARRAAVVLQTLKAMNENGRDRYTPGPFESEISLLDAVWRDALNATRWTEFESLRAGMAPWSAQAFTTLERWFGPQATAPADRVDAQRLIGRLQGQAPPSHGPVPGLTPVLNAAWAARARFPERTASLERECWRLLRGEEPADILPGFAAAADNGAEVMFKTQLSDWRSRLNRLEAVIPQAPIDDLDRAAVQGRFLQLLSEQEYGFEQLTRLPEASPIRFSELSEWMRGERMLGVSREMFDFLGGVMMRSEGLDLGACRIADALLGEYVRASGVSWASRSIPGSAPLLSSSTSLIHLRFPDWDIWNLPLLAHEFGHVTALATDAFQRWQRRTLARETQGRTDVDDLTLRAAHLHELFSDAFALYCQGPSFLYDCVLLNFDPSEAFISQGSHPSHAERVAVLVAVLDSMNASERTDAFGPGPYAAVLGRVRDVWALETSVALQVASHLPDDLIQRATQLGHQLHDHILDRYFRLGVRYGAAAWRRADDLGHRLLVERDLKLTDLSLRDLLNVAWAARIQTPNERDSIARRIRAACEVVSAD